MIPEFLYQYTTMKSVLAILENKTIRFTRLDSLNDLNEGCCGEYAHLKKYVYVSSWSADERESIPMWSLYGKKNDVLDEGVRIKVPSNLFSYDENGNLSNALKLKKTLGGWNVVTDVKIKPIAFSAVLNSLKAIYGEEDEFIAAKKVIGPIRVKYRAFQEYVKKYSSVVKNEAGENWSTFCIEDIGFEKVDDWAYENEYCFWMQYPYMRGIRGEDDALKHDVKYVENSYIDFFFNEKALPEMEIMLSPNFNMSKLETFISELRRFGFTKELQKSSLDIRI